MYDHSGLFGSHEAIPIQGGGGFGGPSQASDMTYSDLELLRSSSSNGGNLEEKLRLASFSHDQDPTSATMGLDLDFHHQFQLDTKQEISSHLMQASGYQQYSFDPTNLSSSSVLGMLSSGSFQAPGDIFYGELHHDSGSTASTILYDQVNHPSLVTDVLNSLPHDARFLHGFMEGGFVGHGLEDGYRGQGERPQTAKKRQKGGFKGVLKELGVMKNEKQRRERLSNKFLVLKSLVPNSTKPDRATIISDTMDYINELLRTVNELKILVEKKWRRRKIMSKDPKVGDEAVAGDMESSSMRPLANEGNYAFKGSLRSSWLQRKSKETLVDVRIIEDEVNIKVVQRRKVNCLLVVAKVLDELQLELLHLSGGNVGDCHIFMFNAKIHEGSSVYASAIAMKLIEAVDVPHTPFPDSY